jgi:hypothetical protein
MEKRRLLLMNVAILVIALGMAGVGWAAPMGTAFTYQGRLADANSPAEGLYDFEFEVYDALDGGSQQGSTVDVNDVYVIDGYFTAKLDFGVEVFHGDDVWLHVGVRPGELEDPNTYSALSPRQELTPTPYAMHSENADKLDSYDATAFASSGHNHDGVYALISHIHDDRYYTETELQTSGQSVVHWDNLTSVPADLADGDDELTEGEVDAYVADNGYVITWGDIPDIPSDIADGDDDTQLTEGAVETYIANDVLAGYLPYDNGTKLVTSEVYYDSGSGNVGIGDVPAPAAQLTVDGAILREDSTMYGSNAASHINLGTNSRTGTNSQDYSYATVGGGENNDAGGDSSTVAGGVSNIASGQYSTATGGLFNIASSTNATASGGSSNVASGDTSTVGGGYLNIAGGANSVIGGGSTNTASGNGATISGGDLNRATYDYATVGGGDDNDANALYATVAGGANNTASGKYATVSGGGSTMPPPIGGGKNIASADWSTVGGGALNTASYKYATVGGGFNNEASFSGSTVGGGKNNMASGDNATVGGGQSNTASENYATVAGGF